MLERSFGVNIKIFLQRDQQFVFECPGGGQLEAVFNDLTQLAWQAATDSRELCVQPHKTF